VTISGSTVVLGTPRGSNQYQGAAYVFVKPAGGWIDMTETAKLTASDGTVGSNLGWSVAINQAGNTIVAGAPAMSVFGGTGPGAAYLFLKPSTGWVSMTESGKMMASDRSAGDQFGVSAALGNNGAAIGATNAATACGFGAWYMFAKPTTVLSQIVTQTAKLSPCEGSFISGFNGEAVAMGANTVVGGGLDVAFVFEEPENGWADMNQTAILMDPALPAWMGSSVSISGNRVVSGAFGANQQQGLADAFVKPAGGWAGTVNQTAQFVASGGQANDYFGTSIAINGSTVVAGAPFADGGAGAVYVFDPKQ
jgi:FG-GAP repeat